MVERPPRVREVVGSIPGRVIPNTLESVVVAALHGAEPVAGLALRLTGWCRDKWTSSTGN